MTTRYARPILGALCVCLAACSGGGSSGGADVSAPEQPEPAPPPKPPTAPEQPPAAAFTVSEAEGFAPLEVTFDASASADPDGSITGYRWTFGDDTPTAAGVTVTHTFADTGSFTVILEVTDDQGLVDSASQAIRARGATLSGTIRIAATSSVDSDVNDHLTTPVSNNGFGDAQPVRNPLRLGGFVNVAGTGPPEGTFHDGGDPADIFVVELAGKEHLVLSIGDPGADLDLELYDDAAAPALLDASVSSNPEEDPTEDLAAPAEPGAYFVRVVAVTGASNYVLSIGDDLRPDTVRRRAKRLTDPFVPGEVLMAERGAPMPERVGVRPAATGDGLRVQALGRAGAPGPEAHLPEIELPPGATASPQIRMRYRTLHAARFLSRQPAVGFAELNVLRQPMRVPNDPFYERQWHFRSIGLERAWDITTGNVSSRAPLVVAVVDTGLLVEHPDLRNQVLRDDAGRLIGYDFIQDPERANDGDGLDANPRDPGDDELGPGEGSFHGTHVAGTIAAQTDNGVGVAGVVWHARIMPLRALGIDGGTTFDVLQAVRYAAGLDNVSGTVPPVRADVINLSLGSDFHSEAEQQALNRVRARGIFVVASAGNDSSQVPTYPAAYDGVIAVAATTAADRPASYSNFGPHIDLAAPGGDVTDDADGDGLFDGVASTIGTGGGESIRFDYGVLDGTSMAAPHVTGVIALMKSVYPGLTPGEFDVLLRNGRLTRDAGLPGRDERFGWGILDAQRAVVAAGDASGGELGPILSASTGRLDFQAFIGRLDFAISNVGNLPAGIEVTDDVPWLTIRPIEVDRDGFGGYRATVDRSGLADGTYHARIIVDAPGFERVQAIVIDVQMQVVSADPDANAGQHYVILVDPEADEALATQVVTAVSGEYTFELTDVPPGNYRVFAGTDLDDDDSICDGGEACGAFPSLANPEIISIDPHQQPERSDLSFASEFRTTATTTNPADQPVVGPEGVRMTKGGGR